MQNIFITGSNGLTGQKLLTQVHENLVIKIVAIAKTENKVNLSPNTTFVQLDLINHQATQELFAIHCPTILIHTAAMTLPDSCEQNQTEAYRQNVEVVENLITCCAKHNTFFVHLSTDFVFDGTRGLYAENDLPNPVNYYGYTKFIAEKRVQESQISWAIIRTCLVYGYNNYMNRSNIVLWVKNNLENKKPIKVVADQFRTPTLVDDLAKAAWQIALEKQQGIWHISGNDYLSPFEMASQIADFFGLDNNLITPTTEKEFLEIAKRPLKTGFNITKAQEKLGFVPTPFKMGLQKMFMEKLKT
jgi:dTDP-4-dehydrorhamnose reductase